MFLSLFVEAKPTKHEHLLIMIFINSQTSNNNVLSSYQSVLKSEKNCCSTNMVLIQAQAQIESSADSSSVTTS